MRESKTPAPIERAATAPTARRFPEDFKHDAVRLVVDEKYTFKAAARAVGVSEKTLRDWHKRLAPPLAPCGEDATLEELREENKRLRRQLKWAELKTNGLSMKVFSDGGHHALQYTDEAVWDPGSRQLFFCGEGHGAAPRFVKYTESTNRWMVLPLPKFGPVHAYDHQAIDPLSGTYYRGRYYSHEIQQYNVKEGTWSKLTDVPATSGLGGSRITFGFDYFPEMRGLVVFLSANGLYFYDIPKNQWRQLAGSLGRYAYHEIARYNPVHKVAVFGGGNDSKGYRSKDLWKLGASGQITKLRETPLPVGVTGTIFTVDPASGKYLVFGRGKQVYEYDVTTDTWAELKGQQPPIFTFGPDLKGSAVFGCVATPVSSHRVVMFVKYDGDHSKVFLYKHAAAGERHTSAVDADSDFRRRCQAPGVVRYFNFDSQEKADQWMTFQVHVKIGTWYKNDKRYHRESTIELWVAEEGGPSKLVISRTDYDIANNNPAAKYGKIWLLPYNTGKDPRQAHPTAYTWYDELIVSKQRVPDPAVRASLEPTAP